MTSRRVLGLKHRDGKGSLMLLRARELGVEAREESLMTYEGTRHLAS